MPLVKGYAWSGTSCEAEEKIVRGVTGAFESLGIPAQAVEVIIIEVPKENWGIGGELASKSSRGRGRPSSALPGLLHDNYAIW
ncbi:MAG: tautomerase family protein [Desulfurococcaceae archaeon]